MPDFHQLDLAKVYSDAAQINAMREASTFNKLRTLAAEEELAAMPEQRQIQRDAAGRAAAVETRAATEFGQEQQIANTKMLNAATAEIMQNPSAFSRWAPQLKQAGVLPQDFDPSTMRPEELQATAKGLFESTSQALQALNASSGAVQAKPSALIEQYNQARAEGYKGGYLEFVQEQSRRQVGAQYGAPVNQPGVGVLQPSRVDPSLNVTLSPEADASAAAAQRAGAEAAATTTGKATAERQIDLPRLEQNASQSIKIIDDLKAHPGLPYITGLYSKAPIIPDTDQAAADALARQIAGATFLEAYNTLKGGGQITETEGTKAQEAIGRLSRAQSTEDYTAALDELRGVLSNGLDRARRQAGGGAQAPQGGGATQVEFEDQYNSLPSGSQYIAPDGSTRTKR